VIELLKQLRLSMSLDSYPGYHCGLPPDFSSRVRSDERTLETPSARFAVSCCKSLDLHGLLPPAHTMTGVLIVVPMC
jgi:hypothetical protein